MVRVNLTATGLDPAIAMFKALSNSSNVRAVANRVFHAPGAARDWLALARVTATDRLKTTMQPERQVLIPSFVNTITYAGQPTGAEFGMRLVVGLISSAHTYLQDRYTTLYGTGETQVRRMKRRGLGDLVTLFTDPTTGKVMETLSAAEPEAGSEAHQAMLDRARELVREWVLTEKELDERDQPDSFDPDAVTDRVCAIVGLNTDRTLLGTRAAGRESGVRNLPAARARLTERIEAWIADIKAGIGTDKLTREQRAHMDEFGEVAGYGGDPAEQAAAARAENLARRQRLTQDISPITPDEAYAWVHEVVDAWTQMIVAEFRRRFQSELQSVVRHYFKGPSQASLGIK